MLLGERANRLPKILQHPFSNARGNLPKHFHKPKILARAHRRAAKTASGHRNAANPFGLGETETAASAGTGAVYTEILTADNHKREDPSN